MKKIFLAVFCLVFFSCVKDEKKKETPSDTTPEKEVVLLKEPVKLEEALIFTVQIAACKKEYKKLEVIENVNVYEEGTFFKYRIGAFQTYKEATAHKKQLNRKHKGVFVQALLNNAPISITEALLY
ncbi:hypothetical protein PI23P_00320 [Polaribacter irgensii 23-P]|uniref:SPOR domain-containing protein n=1 Tax=Polaribacter irgensii 23-P TaxID=313594 RepID=A4C2T0_9FLAO|nr:SPOR domain-containing protein [Polaribacter irgensii]EAR11604.1 hypothetical protein PI23P_00320 [Polaribacter irgensii 23-P]